MGDVTSLRRDPLDYVAGQARDRDLAACALVGLDSEGNYLITSAGASPEELLMMGELLREYAMRMTST